ncbi:sensor histidine kinase [Microvirga arabica]|uniref:sensor histidine kinase n=1 Tax=Microvirga arabica TaxID=1128671 RepID=UPI0019397C61|nr:histidine kinase dimerization/phosphoacceptor domain -containing protein [Microvirga arabica]MBM1175246.1 response regulator [Microvirga arabica]
MRILFVDDDPDARVLAIRAVAQEFPNAGFREASDLVSLDQTLLEQAPDILVTDFDLRWTDGIAIFDRVKATNPFCCCVMFTGTGNEELAVRAIKHGFDDYVVKGAKQLRRLATAVRTAYDRGRELRELGENRDLVLKELYHRLHNNLQIVISLLRMTEKAIATQGDREQLADLGRRIQALSALQEEFYRSEDFRKVDFAAFLQRLAGSLTELKVGYVRLTSRLEAMVLPVDLAVPFGLIANEIFTNSLKHALPEGRSGGLSVALERLGDRAVLTVADDGDGVRGVDLFAATSGLGMRLIGRLTEQVGGEISFERGDTGAICRINVPL